MPLDLIAQQKVDRVADRELDFARTEDAKPWHTHAEDDVGADASRAAAAAPTRDERVQPVLEITLLWRVDLREVRQNRRECLRKAELSHFSFRDGQR